LGILLQDCDNEAVVHNKENFSENHNPDSNSETTLSASGGCPRRPIGGIGRVPLPGWPGIFDPSMKPNGRWRD
jgi:hypothetical protein